MLLTIEHILFALASTLIISYLSEIDGTSKWIPIGFLFGSETGDLPELNEAACRLYGFNHAPLIKTKHTNLLNRQVNFSA